MYHFRILKKKILEKTKKNLNKIHSLKYLDIYLFLASCAIIIIVKFIQIPSLTYNAEMFVENGSNFFIHAYKDTILTNLVTTDAGYLPLTQRLIALILVKIFHIIILYPLVSQVIAITFIAIFSSLLNFNTFSKIHPSAFIRFILGPSIALISDYELNALINFIYYGAILLFLAIFINKDKLNNILFSLLTLAVCIIMLSKGQFIVFIPIFLLLAFLHVRKKQYKSFIYYLFAISSGIIQFVIMYLNAPESESNKNVFLIPYYIAKTVYYYILTYRHVFFGYVTKEGTNFISLGILLILFIIGIKTVIKKKDSRTLYVFLAGNFIAICSLFLVVVVLNNNVKPEIKNIPKTISNAKSVTAASQEIISSVYENARSQKNIFDIKHFANLRSLFFSNLFIFLTGILVILNIFPKKSDKLIILVILLFTSGAFGQIVVEENYPKKELSYSQWGRYYHLIDKKQFCIPLNPHPYLLKHNCDYLIDKDQKLPLPNFPTQSITLSKMNLNAKNWEIQAVILVNKPNQYTPTSSFILHAYDKNGAIVGEAKQIVPGNYEYIYYLFDNPVSNVEKLTWKTPKGKAIKIAPNIIVFGNNKLVHN